MTTIRTFTGYGLTDGAEVDNTTAGERDDVFTSVDGAWTVDGTSSPRPPSVQATKPAGGTARLRWEGIGELEEYAVAFDFEFDQVPTATNSILQCYMPGYTDTARVDVSGQLHIRVRAGTTRLDEDFSYTLQAGIRYRCEFVVVAGVEGWAYLYEGDSTTPVSTAGGEHSNFGVLDMAWFGQVNGNDATYTIRYDDMRVADTAELLGPGFDPNTGEIELIHAWPGIPVESDTYPGHEFSASFKATGATTARVVVAEDISLNQRIATSVAATFTDEIALTAPVGGLSAGTTFHYGVELDNQPPVYVGSFRTAGAGPQRVLFGSCQNTGSSHVVFLQMAAEDADFLIHCGDLHYNDVTTNDPNAFRAAMDASIGAGRFQTLVRGTPWTWIWDNHDFGGTGSWSGSAMAPAAKTVMKQYQPATQLAGGDWSADEFWKTWTRDLGGGKTVRFIQIDERTNRDSPLEEPGPDKTMLGATQKAWLKNLLVTDSADLFVIATHGVWYQTGSDRWSTFADEFKDLANHIHDNDLTRRCFFIGGDLHAVWFDSGTLVSPGLDYELSPQAGGAAFNSGGTGSSLDFSGGHHPNGSGRGQYGVLDLSQDDGVIAVRYRGMQDDGETLIAGTVYFGDDAPESRVRLIEWDGTTSTELGVIEWNGTDAVPLDSRVTQ